jgi:hypothetical protein
MKEDNTTLRGSYNCPICLHDSPHSHEGLVRKTHRKWIGVDFDGTLAFDPVNRSDPYSLGEPIMSMVYRVQDWIARGFEVRILTARMYPISYTCGGITRDLKHMETVLRAWCRQHIGYELPCTCQKDGLMEVLWDDRAVQVIKNTGSVRAAGETHDYNHTR